MGKLLVLFFNIWIVWMVEYGGCGVYVIVVVIFLIFCWDYGVLVSYFGIKVERIEFDFVDEVYDFVYGVF